MIRYIPFLKAKRGELTAMGELDLPTKQAICPFFDFPRKKVDYDSVTYATTVRSIATSLKKHWGKTEEFYFDDLDIGQKLKVEAQQPYAFVLNALKDFPVIPVVGLDRDQHNAAVAALKRTKKLGSAVVAFRVERDDFEDFALVNSQIEYDLQPVFELFDEIDLVLDCRLCTGLDVSETGQQIAAFAKAFSSKYTVRRVIVSGSSLPASIGEVLSVNSSVTVARRELAIIAKVKDLSDHDIFPGDYTTVSPFYSDADLDPRLMQNVMTPRLIYPYKQSHYVSRGLAMKTGGQDQYVGMTAALCKQGFFRGRGYSAGDEYFDDKRRRVGNNATNGTVVKPSVVAHITYMVLDAKF